MGQSCPGGLYDRSNDDVICATVYIEYLYNEWFNSYSTGKSNQLDGLVIYVNAVHC